MDNSIGAAMPAQYRRQGPPNKLLSDREGNRPTAQTCRVLTIGSDRDEGKAVGWSHHRRLCYVSIFVFPSQSDAASVSFAQKLRQLGDIHRDPPRHLPDALGFLTFIHI